MTQTPFSENNTDINSLSQQQTYQQPQYVFRQVDITQIGPPERANSK